MNRKNLAPHGQGVRGLNLSRSSVSFWRVHFGRIFRALSSGRIWHERRRDPGEPKASGRAMVGTDDKPKDGPDTEESGIPALYTYLGQFVDPT